MPVNYTTMPESSTLARRVVLIAALLLPGAKAWAQPCPLDPPCVDAQLGGRYCSLGGGRLSACGLPRVMLVAGHSYWVHAKGCSTMDQAKLTVTGPRGEIVYERATHALDGCITAKASGGHLFTMREHSPTGICWQGCRRTKARPKRAVGLASRCQAPLTRADRSSRQSDSLRHRHATACHRCRNRPAAFAPDRDGQADPALLRWGLSIPTHRRPHEPDPDRECVAHLPI